MYYYGQTGYKAVGFPAASMGTVRIGIVSIPVNVTKARVRFHGLTGFKIYPAPASWLAPATAIEAMTKIN